MFSLLVNCVCTLPCKVFSAGFEKLTIDLEKISPCNFNNNCFEMHFINFFCTVVGVFSLFCLCCVKVLGHFSSYHLLPFGKFWWSPSFRFCNHLVLLFYFVLCISCMLDVNNCDKCVLY